MRWIVFLYLMIGIVLLVVGFFATSDCPNKNARIENDIVFILTWPVSDQLMGIIIFVVAGVTSGIIVRFAFLAAKL